MQDGGEETHSQPIPDPSSSNVAASQSPKQTDANEQWGITRDGNEFLVPKTAPPISFNPAHFRLPDWLSWLGGLAHLLALLSPLPDWVLVLNFLWWRLMYNAGIGWLLHIQSHTGAFTGLWKRYPLTRKAGDVGLPYHLMKKLFKASMGKDYDYDRLPNEFNAWVGFRLIVDVVLAMDLSAFVTMALRFWVWPSPTLGSVATYIIGIALIAFALWAKSDAYRVVRDYAWYWGDFFFLLRQNQELVFDRVFSLSPHPMYTIGYAWYYGASLVTQSYTVLYVALGGHMMQLIFLAIVENPHIEKTYNLVLSGITEKQPLVEKGYLNSDLVVFKNFNPLRSSDVFMVIIMSYSILFALFGLPTWVLFGQVIVWRLVFTLGLGTLLWLQHHNAFWTRFYCDRGFTLQYAFDNWKRLFNLCSNMQWIVFACAAFHQYSNAGASWEHIILKHTVAALLLALNVWSAKSSYDVLGEFGWFYGDFFLDDVSVQLSYQGIYRFLNNPDSLTGYAGFYGLALMAESRALMVIALLSQLSNYMFVLLVEKPHMHAKYGQDVRRGAGVTTAIRQIVGDAAKGVPGVTDLIERVDSTATTLKRSTVDRTRNLLHRFVNKYWTNNGQYARSSIQRYEDVYGRGYTSSGGMRTSLLLAERLGWEADTGPAGDCPASAPDAKRDVGDDTTSIASFVQHAQQCGGRVVLNMGSGLGGSSFYLASAFDAFVIGLDKTTDMVTLSQQRSRERVDIAADHVRFLCNDVCMVDIAEHSFDAVWTRDCLLHISLDQRVNLFQNVHKWLKPGGKLLGTDYGRRADASSMSSDFQAYIQASDYTLLDEASYVKYLTDAGFEHVQVTNETDQFVRDLRIELQSLLDSRSAFVDAHGRDAFDAMVQRWQQKIRFCRDGDMFWFVIEAVKGGSSGSKQ